MKSTYEEALEYCIQHYVDRGNTREHAIEIIAWRPEEKIFEIYDIIKREEKEYGNRTQSKNCLYSPRHAEGK